MAPRFDAVLFDLDDTLWHFNESPPIEEIAEALAARIGPVIASWGDQRPTISYTDLDLALFSARQAAIADADAAGDHREPDFDALHIRELARYGITATADQARELHLAMGPAPELVRPQLFDGVLDTLDALRSSGLRLGAVTNRSQPGAMLANEFRYHGIETHFNTVVSAGDTGLRKPHPASIELALSQLNVVPPRALMVGDDPVRDVAGARAAGVTSVLFGRDKPTTRPDHEPDHRLDAIAGLLELLG